MANKIQIRRGLASLWVSVNPTLSNGEFGYETDTGKTKIGNGVDDWNTLGYEAGGSGVSQAYVDAADALKVDKVTGESLINVTDITKLSGIEAGAQVNDPNTVIAPSGVLPVLDGSNLTGLPSGAAINDIAPSFSEVYSSAYTLIQLGYKVDKINGKGLSTNDFTDSEKVVVDNTSGVNTGDQDLSGKVDKVTGKQLSTNDYTTIEQTKLAGITAGAQVNDPNTTTQGNTFNGNLQLIKTNGTGQYPALDGSLITGLAGNVNPKVFNVMSYGAVADGATDNTTVFATVIAAIITHGGGVMYLPAGVYIGQIVIPFTNVTSNYIAIKIMGEFPPVQNVGSVLAATYVLPNNGTIIKSNATSGAVISAAGSSISAVNVIIRNLEVRTYDNPQIHGIDLTWAAQMQIENVFVNTGVYDSNASNPTYSTTGILTPAQGNQSTLLMTNVSISGYFNGMTANEHLVADALHIYGNYNGMRVLTGGHPINIGRMDCARNVNDIYLAGSAIIHIAQFDIELIDPATYDSSTSAWQVPTFNVYDAAGQTTGDIRWTTAPHGSYLSHKLYVSTGCKILFKECGGSFSAVTGVAGSFSTLFGSALSSNSFSNSGAFTSTYGLFSSSLGLTVNANSQTALNVTNTTNGGGASASFNLNSGTGSGTATLYKYSATTSPYKSFNPKDFGIYNSTGGNISILNDVAAGNINLTAGAASAPQATLTSSGWVLSVPTVSTQYKLSALNTAPASSTDTGTLGEIRITAGYIYVCIATNTWVRSALTTF